MKKYLKVILFTIASLIILLVTFVSYLAIGPIICRLEPEAKIVIQSLIESLNQFHHHCHFYPSEDIGLENLVFDNNKKRCPNFPKDGFSVDGVIPLDPWERDYCYKLIKEKPLIISSGEDGIFGTEDDIFPREKDKALLQEIDFSTCPQIKKAPKRELFF